MEGTICIGTNLDDEQTPWDSLQLAGAIENSQTDAMTDKEASWGDGMRVGVRLWVNNRPGDGGMLGGWRGRGTPFSKRERYDILLGVSGSFWSPMVANMKSISDASILCASSTFRNRFSVTYPNEPEIGSTVGLQQMAEGESEPERTLAFAHG